MNFAFCLFRYFPFGGLQRDCLDIIQVCQQRGHRVTVFTTEWTGPVPEGLKVQIISGHGFTNHGRCHSFVRKVLPCLRAGRFDAVVGFNKMPALDIYYAGDPCFQDQARRNHGGCCGWFYQATPRFQQFVALEKAVFESESGTEVLLLTPVYQSSYVKYYQTPLDRFHLLPPGICKDRWPIADCGRTREEVRRDFLRSTEGILLLVVVGAGWRWKGFDRAVRAFGALPPSVRIKTRMVAVGHERGGANVRLARQLGIADRVALLPPRPDIARLYLGADLLIHPAYCENTGGVILESMLYGLPVLTTDVCGYAEHVLNAKAGLVVPSPFSQELMNQMLQDLLLSYDRQELSSNGHTYTRSLDLHNRSERVARIIEARAEKNRHAVPSA